MGEPTAEDLGYWYDNRSKPSKKGQFVYDEQGNLLQYSKDKQSPTLLKTIVLPTYRPPISQEFKDMESDRLDRIAQANHTFEDSRKKLYQALQDKSISHYKVYHKKEELKFVNLILINLKRRVYFLIVSHSLVYVHLHYNNNMFV
jgi:hypothetical protein